MSTINPDERERRIAATARPVVRAAAILVQLLGPVLALLWLLGILPPHGGYILLYVLLWVAVGLAAMFALPGSRNPYLIAAFMLAYVGGLFLTILMIDAPDESHDTFSLLGAAVPYAVGTVIFVLYRLRESAITRITIAAIPASTACCR